MKLFGRNIQLSVSKPKLDTEQGTSAASGRSTLLGDEIFPLDKVTIDKLVKMFDNDGTTSGLYSILTYPILANPWSLEPEDDSPEAKKQADFVNEALSKPPHKGGMSTPFDIVIAQMLRAVLEKHMVFEKVLTLSPEGKIVYSKIAHRDNSTVTILQDSRGGFNGIKQQAYINGKYDTVVIDKDKIFMFTFGKQHNWLEGRSAFRSAYPHYVKKHKLYYLSEQAVQVGALPPRIVKGKAGAKQGDIDDAVAAIDQIGIAATVGIPDGYSLEPYKVGEGRVDPLPLIDHHNAEMARSILAQFIMLGSGENSSGSWALSKDQSDMFVIALRGLMSSLEEHITSYLIPDLINYNFATPKYPKFKFANLTDAMATALKEVALKILDKRPEGIPESMIDGIVQKLAAQLEIELPKKDEAKTVDENGDALPEGGQAVVAQTEQIAQQALNGAQVASLLSIIQQVITGQIPFDTAEQTIAAAFPFLPKATVNAILQPAKNFTPEKQELSRKKKVALAEKWNRALTPAEGKVNFDGLKKKHDQLEADFVTKTKPVYDKMTADALARLEKILDANDTEALSTFTLGFGDEYRNAMLEEMLAAYGYAKVGAADELDVKAPATPAESRDILKSMAQSVVDKQYQDLVFQIQTAVNQALRKSQLSTTNLATSDVLATVAGLLSSFYSDKIGYTAGIAIGSAINTARDDVFGLNKDKISLYQYSAILDEKTCAICEDLDGSVVNEQEYRTTDWLPPIHGNCRCIWVAILEDETEQPDVTGLPTAPGDVEEPLLHELFKGVIELSRKNVASKL